MNEWKVVPVEPDHEMHRAYWEDAGRLLSDAEFPAMVYKAMLAAAPRPPVVLPPLPKPFINLFSELTPVMRDAWADQMQAYARAALAQYGIVDRQEDAA
jgi:hypothetical protein